MPRSTSVPLSLSKTQARRLAITKQGLSRELRPSSVLDTVRMTGCLQIDPLNVVARTQQLVLFSRLGRGYDPQELDSELWDDRTLFHYWAHAASIVLTEDYPIHNYRMRNWLKDSEWGAHIRGWIADNRAFRNYIRRELRRHGTRRAKDLEDRSVRPWTSTGWTHAQNVSRMLDFMWINGEITIGGRVGLERTWTLLEDWLPEWTPREKLVKRATTRRAVSRALQAMGPATPKQIKYHFTRDVYPDLNEVLGDMVRRREIIEVDVEGLKGQWYMHADDLAFLDMVSTGWRGRTILLSPFDNLICDRERTLMLWDFDFKIEIYVPPKKRRYGYYVLPLLHNDKLVARIDSKMDRKTNTYAVNAIHLEPGAKISGAAIDRALKDLAKWLGATNITRK
jgi:uncharacterized protein YcaQ